MTSRATYLPLARPAATEGPWCGSQPRCHHLHVAEADGEATCCAFDEPLRVKRGRRTGQQMFERCELCRTAERLFGDPGVEEPATASELLDYETGNARTVVAEWLDEQRERGE